MLAFVFLLSREVFYLGRGVSVDFWCVFMHFKAFIKGTASLEGV